MAGRVSLKFYRSEADRLIGLASAVHSRRTRLKLLEVAAQFRDMAVTIESGSGHGAAGSKARKLKKAG